MRVPSSEQATIKSLRLAQHTLDRKSLLCLTGLSTTTAKHGLTPLKNSCIPLGRRRMGQSWRVGDFKPDVVHKGQKGRTWCAQVTTGSNGVKGDPGDSAYTRAVDWWISLVVRLLGLLRWKVTKVLLAKGCRRMRLVLIGVERRA